MLNPRAILKTCLFISIGSFWFGAPLYAQNMEGINSSQKRFEIGFGGGWGLYSMGNINKHYINEVGIFDDHIDNGPNVFGEIGYFISPNVSANLGVTYLHGGIISRVNAILPGGYSGEVDSVLVEESVTITALAPELKIKYRLPIKKMDLFFGGGTAWCLGQCVLKSTILPERSISLTSSFTAQGIGFLASTEAWYNLNKTLSFGAEIGYRHFATGDLKNGDNDGYGKVGTVMSLRNYKVNLDFSGPFILGGLRVKL